MLHNTPFTTNKKDARILTKKHATPSRVACFIYVFSLPKSQRASLTIFKAKRIVFGFTHTRHTKSIAPRKMVAFILHPLSKSLLMMSHWATGSQCPDVT